MVNIRPEQCWQGDVGRVTVGPDHMHITCCLLWVLPDPEHQLSVCASDRHLVNSGTANDAVLACHLILDRP